MSPATNASKVTCKCCGEPFPRLREYIVNGKGPFCDWCGPDIYLASKAPTETAIELVRLRKRMEKEAGK